MKQERLSYDRYDRLCAFRNGLKDLVREPMEPGERLRLYNYLAVTKRQIQRIEKRLSMEFVGDYNKLILVSSRSNIGSNWEYRHKLKQRNYQEKYYQKNSKRVYYDKMAKIKADPEKHEKQKAIWRENYKRRTTRQLK